VRVNDAGRIQVEYVINVSKPGAPLGVAYRQQL
jgi:hypothetical protein